ncbi:MAG: SAM-dependent chlorinase/fluorinase [Bdellovibrionales bacterium]|nr:SAM-dependent chlorinase/fluorinase [Bdellovibrionales bacterium]
MVSRAPQRIVTLTTDFGEQDSYVAQMKGRILSDFPEAFLVDLSHSIPRHDIRSAALFLRDGLPAFPSQTIHVVVVDPGVGSSRRGIAVRLAIPGPAGARPSEQWFVGPDNGLLSSFIAHGSIESAWSLIPEKLSPPLMVSATFHGRDVFAPAAARLARGELPDKFSQRVENLASLVRLTSLAEPEWDGRTWSGKIIRFDRFGNAQTNIHSSAAERLSGEIVLTRAACPERPIPRYANYSQIPDGELGLIVDSSGYIELAMNQRSAADLLQLEEAVILRAA